MSAELLKLCEEGTEEEKEILALAVQAIRQKRERKSAYLSGFMGLKGRFVAEDEYEFRVPITSFMMNRAGMVHGGITASLADSTMGSLINQRLPEGYGGAVTAEMKVNYLAPGRGEYLISRAKLLHMGQTLATAACEIKNDKGRLIVYATGTFYMIKAR
nr:PaaI family thioesterase [Lihuaxuella thermophila]